MTTPQLQDVVHASLPQPMPVLESCLELCAYLTYLAGLPKPLLFHLLSGYARKQRNFCIPRMPVGRQGGAAEPYKGSIREGLQAHEQVA